MELYAFVLQYSNTETFTRGVRFVFEEGQDLLDLLIELEEKYYKKGARRAWAQMGCWWTEKDEERHVEIITRKEILAVCSEQLGWSRDKKFQKRLLHLSNPEDQIDPGWTHSITGPTRLLW